MWSASQNLLLDKFSYVSRLSTSSLNGFSESWKNVKQKNGGVGCEKFRENALRHILTMFKFYVLLHCNNFQPLHFPPLAC